MIVDGVNLSRLDLPDFVAALARRHPEMACPVALPDFHRMAEREGIIVQYLELPWPARLVRYSETVVYIQIDRGQPARLWATLGMHELCHYWRDDQGEVFFQAGEAWAPTASEDFAEIFSWHVTQAPRVELRPAKYQLFLDGDGSFSVRVVGTSYRQAALEQICGQKEWHAIEHQLVAQLVLEDTNPYDRNAVRVDIHGLPVGYLSREYAIRYRAMLAREARVAIAHSCLAEITGGWERGGGDRGHYGVRLDLCLPAIGRQGEHP